MEKLDRVSFEQNVTLSLEISALSSSYSMLDGATKELRQTVTETFNTTSEKIDDLRAECNRNISDVKATIDEVNRELKLQIENCNMNQTRHGSEIVALKALVLYQNATIANLMSVVERLESRLIAVEEEVRELNKTSSTTQTQVDRIESSVQQLNVTTLATQSAQSRIEEHLNNTSEGLRVNLADLTEIVNSINASYAALAASNSSGQTSVTDDGANALRFNNIEASLERIVPFLESLSDSTTFAEQTLLSIASCGVLDSCSSVTTLKQSSPIVWPAALVASGTSDDRGFAVAVPHWAAEKTLWAGVTRSSSVQVQLQQEGASSITLSTAGGKDAVFAVEVGEDGGPVWATVLEGGGAVQLYDAAAAKNGSILALAGRFFTSINHDGGSISSAGSSDGFVAILDRDGSVTTLLTLGSSFGDVITGVTATIDGGVAFHGYFSSDAELDGYGTLHRSGLVGVMVSRATFREGLSTVLWATSFGGESVQYSGPVACDCVYCVAAGYFMGSFPSREEPLTSTDSFDGYVALLDTHNGTFLDSILFSGDRLQIPVSLSLADRCDGATWDADLIVFVRFQSILSVGPTAVESVGSHDCALIYLKVTPTLTPLRAVSWGSASADGCSVFATVDLPPTLHSSQRERRAVVALNVAGPVSLSLSDGTSAVVSNNGTLDGLLIEVDRLGHVVWFYHVRAFEGGFIDIDGVDIVEDAVEEGAHVTWDGKSAGVTVAVSGRFTKGMIYCNSSGENDVIYASNSSEDGFALRMSTQDPPGACGT